MEKKKAKRYKIDFTPSAEVAELLYRFSVMMSSYPGAPTRGFHDLEGIFVSWVAFFFLCSPHKTIHLWCRFGFRIQMILQKLWGINLRMRSWALAWNSRKIKLRLENELSLLLILSSNLDLCWLQCFWEIWVRGKYIIKGIHINEVTIWKLTSRKIVNKSL